MDDASVLGSVCGQLKEEAKGHGCCKSLGPDSEVNVGWGFKLAAVQAHAVTCHVEKGMN